MVEYRDLYDANKCVTGKTFIKGEQVPKGYFYLIVIIVIKNSLDITSILLINIVNLGLGLLYLLIKRIYREVN